MFFFYNQWNRNKIIINKKKVIIHELEINILINYKISLSQHYTSMFNTELIQKMKNEEESTGLNQENRNVKCWLEIWSSKLCTINSKAFH